MKRSTISGPREIHLSSGRNIIVDEVTARAIAGKIKVSSEASVEYDGEFIVPRYVAGIFKVGTKQVKKADK